jgi:hypothetical protein
LWDLKIPKVNWTSHSQGPFPALGLQNHANLQNWPEIPRYSSFGITKHFWSIGSLEVLRAAPPFHSILFGMPCGSIGICAVGCQDLPCHTNTSWVPWLCSSCHQSERWVCLHSWHCPLQKSWQKSPSSGACPRCHSQV